MLEEPGRVVLVKSQSVRDDSACMTAEGVMSMVVTPRRRGRIGLRWAAVLALVPILVPSGSQSSAAGISDGNRAIAVGDAWVSPPSVVPSAPLSGVFSTGTALRTDLAGAPVAPTSAAMVANLANQVRVRYNGVAAFNYYNYTTNIYTVPRGQPAVDVIWDDCQGKNYTPSGLSGPGGQFSAVPIPGDATPSAGDDAEMSIFSPSLDKLWEFWELSKKADGWHACWGGRLDGVSSSNGYFAGGFGASATGVALAGGVVTMADAKAGHIDHAMSLAVVDAAAWDNFSWPAQRSDGDSYAADAIPEGTRFRLDPSINVSTLGLTPLATTIARAAQQYGFIVTDKAGAVSVYGEGADGVVAAGRASPWPDALGGTPGYSMMAGFPWDKLQALPKDWGKP
jgi:hypothetical protein